LVAESAPAQTAASAEIGFAMPDGRPSPQLIETLVDLGITGVTRRELWDYFIKHSGGALTGARPTTLSADQLAELAIQLARFRH
jgi:hypothetical protein